MQAKIITLIAAIFLLFSTFGNVGASNQTSAELQQKKIQLQEQMQERIKLKTLRQEELLRRKQEKSLTREEKLASRVAQLEEKRKVFIQIYFERMTKKIQAAIERLEKLILRIKNRIEQIKNNNEQIDLQSIESEVKRAENLLIEVKIALDAADASLEDALLSEDPKEAFSVIKDEVQKIKSSLIEVHRILVHLIGDIKGLRVGTTDSKSTSKPTKTVDPFETPHVTEIPEPTISPTLTPTPNI